MVTSAPPVPFEPAIALGSVAIRIRDLVKRYGAVEAVRGICLDVHEGEIFGLIGPDGAGKTSTFQILAGVMEVDLRRRLKFSACRRAKLARRRAI